MLSPECDAETSTIPNEDLRVEALVGLGGFAKVYRAVDVRTGQRLALKVPRNVHDADSRSTLSREAQMLARLTHPLVLASYGLVRNVPRPMLALEYCPGGSLARQLRVGNVSAKELLHLLAAACTALGHIHNLGVLHLDLKPHNLLLGPGRSVRIADFGSAWWREFEPNPASHGDGPFVTPYYMAPEQWHDEPLHECTDLWSLGVIVYEAYLGVNSTPLGIRLPDRLGTRIQALEEAGTPRELVPLLARALAPAPSDRFQTAVEFEVALRSIEAIPELPARKRKLLPSGEVKIAAKVARKKTSVGMPNGWV